MFWESNNIFDNYTNQKTFKQNSLAKMTVLSKTCGLLFKIVVIGVMFFLIWRAWEYTKPSNFPINHIQINASYEHIDKSFLQNIIASHASDGFFYLNVIGIKQQLLKLPWVAAVFVWRKWPDTIVVKIVEQQAMLQWGDEALINLSGQIFAPSVATFPQNLPIIFGPEEREPEIFGLYNKARSLLESLSLKIEKLYLNPQHYWEILLDNNTIIYLKENNPFGQLELLTSLYRKITANHSAPPKSIDLRYNTDGLAVKWE